MKDFHYLIEHFFTHKDYLVAPELIPGTINTPLQVVFELVLLTIIVTGALLLSRRKEKIKTVFTTIWAILLVWELVIIAWDSTAGKTPGLDLATSLSLYPCSIYLYTMPFVIWGHGVAKRIACGYLCTLGLLGSVVNFLFPISRLTDYSCISFPGFHTFFFHGSMLFTFLVLVLSHTHSYCGVTHWWELFLPCVASLIVSVPANLLNYSALNSDYMYFKGHFFVLAVLFGGLPEIAVTAILYLAYILVPAAFYLPSYLRHQTRLRISGSGM